MSDSNVVGRGSESIVTPEKVKAPLAGVITGLVLLGGLVAWTGTRIATATKAQANVAEKRAVDAERTAALAKQPERVTIVSGQPATWLPTVELDGTLEAEQSASVGFKVGGKIGSLKVKVGDQVKAGALLATLDEGVGEAGERLISLAHAISAAQNEATKLSHETGPALIDAMVQVKEAASHAAERAREAIARVVPESAQNLSSATRDASAYSTCLSALVVVNA